MFLTVHHLVKVFMMILFCLCLTSSLSPEDQMSSLTVLLGLGLLLAQTTRAHAYMHKCTHAFIAHD